MALIKKLKKYGNTLVVSFNKEDIELYGMREGDLIDLSDLFLIDKKEVKHGNLHKNKIQ